MPDFLAFLLRLLASPFRSNLDLEIEVLALRQQLAVYQRSIPRPRLRLRDRLFWCWLSRLWSRWKDAIVIVKPSTVIAWRRRKFRELWAKLSARRGPGRPPVPKEIRDLIRQMSSANVCWGSPRIRSELKMLGIVVAKSTVERYMIKRPKPASPTWRAFLANHVNCLASIDFFTVPTVRNRVLYVLVVLAHLRRRIVHFAITEHPTAAWTARQATEAFPWDTAPRYMIRDRDSIYGDIFRGRVKSMGIKEVLIAPRSPWQSPFVERLVGSVRRDCLDHVVVLGERHLRHVLTSYFAYYHEARCHMALDGDAPEHREVQPPEMGKVIEIPEVNGLHHRYVRRAA
ncbi:MAG: transposase family protein [Myxococcales bacterium]|nr:transposase family protein [Myxococcales bacterium]